MIWKRIHVPQQAVKHVLGHVLEKNGVCGGVRPYLTEQYLPEVDKLFGGLEVVELAQHFSRLTVVSTPNCKHLLKWRSICCWKKEPSCLCCSIHSFISSAVFNAALVLSLSSTLNSSPSSTSSRASSRYLVPKNCSKNSLTYSCS